MKGAIALDSVKMIRAPRRVKINIIGASQNFFRSLRNSHNSLNASNNNSF